MGLAFPMTEVISNHVPSFSYLVCNTLSVDLHADPSDVFHRHFFNYTFMCSSSAVSPNRVFICTCTLARSPTSSLFSSICWKIERPRVIVTSVSYIWYLNSLLRITGLYTCLLWQCFQNNVRITVAYHGGDCYVRRSHRDWYILLARAHRPVPLYNV